MKLRLRTLAWEREFARNLIDADEVDRFAGYQYLMRLARMEELIMHQHSVRANLRQHSYDGGRSADAACRKLSIRFPEPN